jgi:hypothetical protein
MESTETERSSKASRMFRHVSLLKRIGGRCVWRSRLNAPRLRGGSGVD